MELKQLAKAKQWHDTADAVVGVRNNIVHPDNDLTVKGVNYHQTILQAWICAMWICEAVILSLIEYSGPYSDRRTYPKYVGTLDRLPWV
jgi:uncharacterized membrane protein